MLHAIGKLAINLYLEKIDCEYALEETPSREALHLAEIAAFGLTSRKAGYELLKHWQFEPDVWQPIRQQKRPMYASTHVLSTAILTLSLWAVDNLSSFDFEAKLPMATRWAYKELNFNPDERAGLIDEIRFEFNDRQNLFSMLI